MRRSHGKIRPLCIWDALAVAALTVAGWFLLWAGVGILSELHTYLTNLR